MNRCILLSTALLICVSCLSAYAQPPDTLWTQVLGDTAAAQFNEILLTDDGCYVAYGMIGHPLEDMYLVKIDASGNLLWERRYGDWYAQYTESFVQTSDGGFALVSYTSGGYNEGGHLTKTDAHGIIEWQVNYVDYNLYYVLQTPDGGYVLSGGIDLWPDQLEGQIRVIKTDPLGSIEWEQNYGGLYDQSCRAMELTSDGGFVFTGISNTISGTHENMYILKTDAQGNFEWDNVFAGAGDEYGEAVRQTADGGYILCGHTRPQGTGNWDVYVVKTDAYGNELWEETYGDEYDNRGYDIQQTADGGYVISGKTYFFQSMGDIWYLLKLDADGNIEWETTYPTDIDGYCYSVVQSADGSYVTAGSSGNMDSWMLDDSRGVIVAFEGASPVEVALTPHDPTIIIPGSGGSFSFDLEIRNGDVLDYRLDVWTEVILPGNIPFTVLQKNDLLLAGGAVISQSNLTQAVPWSVQAGDYLYRAVVRDADTWDILTDDSFPFEKQTGGYSTPDEPSWPLTGWQDDAVSSNAKPERFGLVQVSPNPFNPSTVISFKLQDASIVTLAVYDVTGREVARLVNGWREPGVHEVTFDGSGLVSGVYVYRITAGDLTAQGKMVLLK